MLVRELANTASTDIEVVLGGPPRAEALLAGAGQPVGLTADLLISKATYPGLDSHRIGNVVVPSYRSTGLRACAPDTERPEAAGVS